MEKNNDLITVIEELLEADMTAPKKVKNPQNKMAEESHMKIIEQNHDYKAQIDDIKSYYEKKALQLETDNKELEIKAS